MKLKSLIILSISFLLCTEVSFAQINYTAIHSGTPLFDQNNREVNAHGACIVKEGDTFYLFGEYKSDTANVFTGFSCYSSKDLTNWKFEKIVLPVQSDGLMGPNRVGERVKVMKCPLTGEFVMYMHSDNLQYKDPNVAFATCKTINGEYKFRGELLYEGKAIRKWDLGTFQDTDGTGYLLIHHGYIYQLAPDYKSAVKMIYSNLANGESPAMFHSKGQYYWLTSHTTSWERNDNFYLTAPAIEGPWTKKGLFAPAGSLTWNSQCSFVLPLTNGTDTLFMYMGDRWSFPRQGSSATYVWQPVTVENGEMSIPRLQENWQIDFKNMKVQAVRNKSVNLTAVNKSGDWKTDNGIFSSNQKGAVVSYSFNGKRVGINAISNNTSGYGKITITSRKGKVVLNSIVDFYSLNEYSSQKFISPLLSKGNYTLTLEVLGEHPAWSDKRKSNYGSTDNFVVIEEVYIVK